MFRTDKLVNVLMSMNQKGSLNFVSTFGQFSVTSSDDTVGSC